MSVHNDLLFIFVTELFLAERQGQQTTSRKL